MALRLEGEVGSNFWVESDEGIVAVRRDKLANVIAGPNAVCSAQADNALLNLGDAHPCFPGLVVRRIRGTENQNDNTKYDIEYEFRAPNTEDTAGGQFSMAGSLTTEITTTDRTGTQLLLTYTYPATYKDLLLAGQTREQVPGVEFQAPTQILRWTRLQTSFNAAYTNTNAIHGTLNELTIYSKDPETLLCTRAEVEKANAKWREIYEFQWRRTGWKVPATFLQEDDNRPVKDPPAGATLDADVLPLYNYSLLGLTLPSG